MTDQQQMQKIATAPGFVAALDQSGGSTPKALRLYGIEEDAYASNAEMFDRIHEMRCRIIKSPSFTGEKVVGAILFENTMDRDIEGTPVAEYLWSKCGVVPFLKVDQGLAETQNDVQVMKPIAGLTALLKRAKSAGIFGTKMRSVINGANAAGIGEIVDQQFAIGGEIISVGLMPILEPEVSISIADKAAAEDTLNAALLERLNQLPTDQQVMLKLTLPEAVNHYQKLINHPRVLRVVALSGGYSRTEANGKLAQNCGMIASFSRALTEGLSAQQSDADFNHALGQSINGIYQASVAG
ncbi:MAG: fructose bisphosphate aldolase [Rhodobacteraceae bacterium]|nr:MAG: fructose bisphosphate aldolase [Paracoccaceae bacterium]